MQELLSDGRLLSNHEELHQPMDLQLVLLPILEAGQKADAELHEASREGHGNVAQLLLEGRASPTMADQYRGG